MLTVTEIINARKKRSTKPDENELRRLPYKQARIYGRVSTPSQIRDSRESIREIARLVELAKHDGYRTNLQADEIEKELLEKGGGTIGLWQDGEVVVDVRDLGLSGQLSSEKRIGLPDLQKSIREGVTGAVYLTEGVSRLSRDKDHLLPYELLKLLKQHKCRIRTPEGIWNPAIERDWDYLAEEFEDAIDESKLMNKRLYRRRAQKAKRGEFAGEAIIPGFILPITGHKPNGQYEYGKIEPYPPHAEIDTIILQEFIRQGGIRFRTLRALKGLTFPYFPAELSYMERLTSLRACPRLASGYGITSALIHGLTTNPKLIGVSQWGDGEANKNNHKPAVPEELFLEACQLALERGKPKGRAVNFKPMEWSGLLICMKHPESRLISGHGSTNRYVCARDYLAGNGPTCLDINGRFLDEPLERAVLSQLCITAQAEKVIMRLEAEAKVGRLNHFKSKQEITRLERDLAKWQSLLTSCVDEPTGWVDKEKEALYWDKIHEIKNQINELSSGQSLSAGPMVPDFQMVREFMSALPENWVSFNRTLRNRFLKCLIDRVEIHSDNEIEATIFWKAGLQQKIIIRRQRTRKSLEKPWTDAENDALRTLYPSYSVEDVMAVLPGRSWHAITNKAQRLHLLRESQRRPSINRRPWTVEDDAKLKIEYEKGTKVPVIAATFRRSTYAIQVRAAKLKLTRNESVNWQVRDNKPIYFQEASSSQGGD